MRTAFIFVLYFSAGMAHANEIIINVTGSQQRESFDGKPICELTYDITNNSTGTIHYLSVSIDGWDDRGTKLDELLGASFSNVNLFSRTPISTGSTVSFEQDNGFKTPCEYLGSIQVTEVKPEYCNIRMLPEDINCFEIITVTSSVGSITLK